MAEAKSVLHMESKNIVVPGDILAEGMEYLPSNGTYRQKDHIYANQTGLLIVDGKVLKVIPVAGAYIPKRNDTIICKVIDILMSGWRLDTNSPYSAVLQLKDASFDYIKKGADLTNYFALDEYVVCKIVQVTSQKLVDVSMRGPGLQKLSGGRIMHVNAAKVPRMVGKRASMVNMVKHATECQVIVGQNGLVWLKGKPEAEVLVAKTIRKIEREAHVPGLTERIKAFLEKETGKKIENVPLEEERDDSYERPRRESREDRPRRGPPRRGPRRGFRR